MCKKLLLVFLPILLLLPELKAQTEFSFVTIPPDARGLALGKALSSVPDDINSIHWNTAFLSTLENLQISFTHSFWIADLNYDNFSINLPISTLGAIAFDFKVLQFGKIHKTEIGIGETETTISAGSLGISVAYSFLILPRKLSIGIRFSFLNEIFENENNATYGIGFDTGIFWGIIKNLNFGLSVRNIGFTLPEKNEYLPLEVQTGISYRLKNTRIFDILLIATDYLYTREFENQHQFLLGTEANLAGLPENLDIYLRLGMTAPSYSSKNFLSYLSFGLGIEWKALRFDWCFKNYGQSLGWVHTISVVYKIKTPKFLKNKRLRKEEEEE